MKKNVIKSMLLAILCSIIASCSPIIQASLTSQSKKNDACVKDIKDGIQYVLDKNGATNTYIYANTQNVNILNSGKALFLETPEGTYQMVFNNIKGKPYLTLFELQISTSTMRIQKRNPFGKGITSYPLTNCNCN